jgi:hypothetical protein
MSKIKVEISSKARGALDNSLKKTTKIQIELKIQNKNKYSFF